MIPAFLSRKLNHEVVQLGMQKKYNSVTCRQVIEDFREHLLFDPDFKKFQLSQQTVDEWISIILSFSEVANVCKDPSSLQPPIPHINDAPIVMAASCSKSDYMVTWNKKHLLELLRSDHVCFVTPTCFIKILRPFCHFLYQLLIRIRIRSMA